MGTIGLIIVALSWIACSLVVGRAAGNYYRNRTASWFYLGVSLVLSPLAGGVLLACSAALDYVEARGRS